MNIALSIAGFDPSSGAGITADLAVFAAHGLFGTACLTAATVQSTQGVRSVHQMSPTLVRETLECLCEDMPPAGIKIGMLASAEIIEEVASFLQQYRARTAVIVVLDPVLRSSSGRPLLAADAVEGIRRLLTQHVDWITPNQAELEVLVGRELNGRLAVESAARELQQGNSLNVVVTGGDQQRPDDLLAPVHGAVEWIEGQRVYTRATHGTGCAFSSALLAQLLCGQDARAAVRQAKAYVEEALRRAPGLGGGHGPAELLWPLGRDRVHP